MAPDPRKRGSRDAENGLVSELLMLAAPCCRLKKGCPCRSRKTMTPGPPRPPPETTHAPPPVTLVILYTFRRVPRYPISRNTTRDPCSTWAIPLGGTQAGQPRRALIISPPESLGMCAASCQVRIPTCEDRNRNA